MPEVLGHPHDARCADRQQRNGRESPHNGMPGKPSGLRLTPLGPFLFLGFEPHALGIDALASRWLCRHGGGAIVHAFLPQTTPPPPPTPPTTAAPPPVSPHP